DQWQARTLAMARALLGPSGRIHNSQASTSLSFRTSWALRYGRRSSDVAVAVNRLIKDGSPYTKKFPQASSLWSGIIRLPRRTETVPFQSESFFGTIGKVLARCHVSGDSETTRREPTVPSFWSLR